MSREFIPTITPEMVNEGMFDAWEIDRIERDIFASPQFRAQLRAWAAEEMRGLVAGRIFASPQFRAQLRAWAAEEMRGLVAGRKEPDIDTDGDLLWCKGNNACRAETLANIERWEQSHD